MVVVDKKILKFISQHHVLTLATSANNKPYCATMFYVFMEEELQFIFTSEHKTQHVKHILENTFVAGAVALETTMIGKIRGIQFTGEIVELKGKALDEARKAYITKFPVATLTSLYLWSVKPDFIKLTDNRLGFGTKLIWQK